MGAPRSNSVQTVPCGTHIDGWKSHRKHAEKAYELPRCPVLRRQIAHPRACFGRWHVPSSPGTFVLYEREPLGTHKHQQRSVRPFLPSPSETAPSLHPHPNGVTESVTEQPWLSPVFLHQQPRSCLGKKGPHLSGSDTGSHLQSWRSIGKRRSSKVSFSGGGVETGETGQ